ncbi:ATP-dependent helicase HrpB [Myxococcus sp. CA056]|uniref:ATP-dependent helicase HrpB n=1 Tax=unclassified Myxococcus TaxID=2648731 RepID=UPI00157B29B4|nr:MULTISPECIES: ATP-dependent helicase HrpB [unclassified Myxococcus]NTX12574.1 ATP-dependent helicase HrpB [Myxococcus sp. CA056]NTX55914.1 ATP-dependent helicase HrpB [Myxococcus sp. CA039A]
MSVDKVGAVSGAGLASVEPGRERFDKVLEGVRAPTREATTSVTTEGVARPPVEATRGVARAEGGGTQAPAGCSEARTGTRVDSVQTAREQQAAQALERVGQAQKRLDHILALAESGRDFTPGELLSLQAQVYRASQELDLAGKVVEKATGGVKQVLQTQV